MPDLFYLVSSWWKQMLAVILLSMAVVVAIVFIKPSEYLSTATALPGSSYATDKASVFNNSSQMLYPALGTPEDLEVIVGTAQLDTVYISVANRFDLAAHYSVKEQGEAAVRKAAVILKKKSKVIKSEYNELKVKVWDTDKSLAPQLANAIIEKVRDIHRDIQNSHNVSLLNGLKTGVKNLQASVDSIRSLAKNAVADANNSAIHRLESLNSQIREYEKLFNEYQLLIDNKPEMVIIVEKARVSDWPDRPKKTLILVVTFALSTLFSFALALLLEKRKSAKQ